MVSSILTRCSTAGAGGWSATGLEYRRSFGMGVRFLRPRPSSLESTGMWIPTGPESRSPARVAVRLGCSPPVPEGAAHGGQLALSTRVRASGVVQFGRLPPTFLLFFDLLLDLLGRVPVYLNCVIKRFHLEYSLPASFIAKRGTETVMAQRTVNQDAGPGT